MKLVNCDLLAKKIIDYLKNNTDNLYNNIDYNSFLKYFTINNKLNLLTCNCYNLYKCIENNDISCNIIFHICFKNKNNILYTNKLTTFNLIFNKFPNLNIYNYTHYITFFKHNFKNDNEFDNIKDEFKYYYNDFINDSNILSNICKDLCQKIKNVLNNYLNDLNVKLILENFENGEFNGIKFLENFQNISIDLNFLKLDFKLKNNDYTIGNYNITCKNIEEFENIINNENYLITRINKIYIDNYLCL